MGQIGKKLPRRRLLQVLAGLMGLLVMAGSAAWLFPRQILTIDSGPVKSDALVVLGGTSDRAVHAAELFKAGEAPLVICTGTGDADINEACLTNLGVPLTDIQLESNARTTQENATLTIPILRARHVHTAIIVTSWYHSRRALDCFKHYGPDIRFYSRPSYYAYHRSDWKRTGTLVLIKAEYLKILGYWICYDIHPL
jgi:uncharacterized SAM-binding protein YcdF (DUF218 family)